MKPEVGSRLVRRSAASIDSWFLGGAMRKRRVAIHIERSRRHLENSTESKIWIQESSARELTELFNSYGSDKGSQRLGHPNGSWPAHNYSEVYGTLFDHCKRHIRSVFECGLGTNNEDVPSNMSASGMPGASLRAWRDYFPNATVIGADIDERVLFQEQRIRTYFVDQTDSQSVRQLWAEVGQVHFDLMIDDGLHTFEAGITLFEGSWDNLARGGVYAIEDVVPSDLPSYIDYFRERKLWTSFIMPPPKFTEPGSDQSLILIRKD